MGTEAWQKEHRRTGLHIKFVDLLEADTGVPRDCLPAAMDDRIGWRKRAMGSTEVALVVIVVVVVVVIVVVVVVVVVVCDALRRVLHGRVLAVRST